MTYAEFSSRHIKLSQKEMTMEFNRLSIGDRQDFIEMFSDDQRKNSFLIFASKQSKISGPMSKL